MLTNAHKSALSRLAHLIPKDSEAADEIAVIERVSRKFDDHARHLLELGGAQTDSPGAIDLGHTVAESLALMRASGRLRHVPVDLELPNQRTFVRIGRTELEQVIFNLVINAVDAVDGIGGREGRVAVRVEAADSFDRARVHVTDNGTGIAPEMLAKIFQPYFTTKPVERGTGLGLSLVQHIVENSDGRVVVVSRLNEGTTASVDFPCTDTATRRASWQPVLSRASSG
jgi:signal transduction histidine kinase